MPVNWEEGISGKNPNVQFTLVREGGDLQGRGWRAVVRPDCHLAGCRSDSMLLLEV